jgi:hypothetical protein
MLLSAQAAFLALGMSAVTNLPIIDLFTGSDNRSHFEQRQLPLTPQAAGSAGIFSLLLGNVDVQFGVTPLPTGPLPSLQHSAPRKQLVLCLAGALNFSLVGEPGSLIFRAGDVMLAEDLFGAGYRWSFALNATGGLQDWVRAYVHLNDSAYAALKHALLPLPPSSPQLITPQPSPPPSASPQCVPQWGGCHVDKELKTSDCCPGSVCTLAPHTPVGQRRFCGPP